MEAKGQIIDIPAENIQEMNFVDNAKIFNFNQGKIIKIIFILIFLKVSEDS